jgi:dUTP pyrophosphatase
MIKIELKEGVEAPKYETEGASGMDVVANSIITAYKGNTEIAPDKLKKMQEGFQERGYIKLRGFERVLFGTGITISHMEPIAEIQVRPRSGNSLKKGILVANSPGTIDSDYRGEIGVILLNATPHLNSVKKGSRIAQILTAVKDRIPVEVSSQKTVTKRGFLGFGSTGSH